MAKKIKKPAHQDHPINRATLNSHYGFDGSFQGGTLKRAPSIKELSMIRAHDDPTNPRRSVVPPATPVASKSAEPYITHRIGANTITVPNPAYMPSDADSPYTSVPIGGKIHMIPNMAWGERHGMVWDGSKWARKDPAEDIAKRMAEIELQRRQYDFDLYKRQNDPMGFENPASPNYRRPHERQGPIADPRDEAQDMAYRRTVEDKLVREEAQRQRMYELQRQAEDDNIARMRQPRRQPPVMSPAPPAGQGPRLQPVFTPGEAQSIQGPAEGTPYNPTAPAAQYGAYVGKPNALRLGNFLDSDGDGVDDRYQTGPGKPRMR